MDELDNIIYLWVEKANRNPNMILCTTDDQTLVGTINDEGQLMIPCEGWCTVHKSIKGEDNE